MMFHFISGLPRSGSTLLSALLRQNPRFHAGITSPVAPLIGAMLRATSADKEHSIFLADVHRERLLRGIFTAYYEMMDGQEVVFDTHRIWCARIAIIARLFPDAKVICCVRNPAWIYDSLECLVQKNLQPSKIFKFDPDTTVYQRVEQVSARNGLVGFALDALQGACCGEPGRLLLLQYETLANNPAMAMRAIYEFIGEPVFEHHFEKVEFDAPEFDRQLGTPGLHTVRGPVCYKERKSILPPALFDKHKRGFWQDHKGTLKVV
jgi:sulfotransferase